MVDLNQRYSRQELFAPIGPEGQKKLSEARVLIIGCGALGSNIANLCARAGIGFLRIVDKDVVELSNLPRQTLFTEEDVKNQVPKAEAGKGHLAAVNSETVVEARVMTVDVNNIDELITDVDLVLDGTDNFPTRYLMNEACVKHDIPWVYGGVAGGAGTTMAFVPGGPCLACVWPEAPAEGDVPTVHTAGVINTVPALIACLQVTEAIKIIVGEKPRPTLWHLELWEGQTASVSIKKSDECPVCGSSS